jgi:hypothetical protein
MALESFSASRIFCFIAVLFFLLIFDDNLKTIYAAKWFGTRMLTLYSHNI